MSLVGEISNENILEGYIVTSVIAGVTPNTTVGKIITLEPGEEVKVELDESSTKYAPVFNFAIPKGDKGDKGDTGEDAYTAAQIGGYPGTHEEFYQSLASIGNINAALDAINGEVV